MTDLKKLFDYQRFDGNSKLQNMIDNVEAKYGINGADMSDMRALSDDELDMVSAAGVLYKDIQE